MPALEEINRERVVMRAALSSAEAAMKSRSGDPREFAKAKRDRQAALDALERLEWAEGAERERLAAQERQAKVDRLREAQEAAARAHAEAAGLAPDLAAAAGDLVRLVKVLRAAQEVVGVGVNHEVFAVREGLLQRPAVEPRVRVDREAALTALRAAMDLCMLAGMSRQAADQLAAQRRL